MARAKAKIEEKSANDSMNALMAPHRDVDIDQMPLITLRDYKAYNAKARELNKKLRECKYPIKQCPVELHPKQRIVFGRNDQPSNMLPVYISDEMIHFDQKLYPGKTYDLPVYVVDYLSRKGVPVWKWFTLPDGSKETRIDHYEPRFAMRTIYEE